MRRPPAGNHVSPALVSFVHDAPADAYFHTHPASSWAGCWPSAEDLADVLQWLADRPAPRGELILTACGVVVMRRHPETYDACAHRYRNRPCEWQIALYQRIVADKAWRFGELQGLVAEFGVWLDAFVFHDAVPANWRAEEAFRYGANPAYAQGLCEFAAAAVSATHDNDNELPRSATEADGRRRDQ